MNDHSYFFHLAQQTAERSNCLSRHVGAAVVANGVVLAEGFNGVSSRFRDCVSAGCKRCEKGGSTGWGYDNCICIHAEQRAIASAAAVGKALSGASIYLTLRPCLQCLLLVYAAGIQKVRYLQEWRYPDERENSYQTLAGRFEVFEHWVEPGVRTEHA